MKAKTIENNLRIIRMAETKTEKRNRRRREKRRRKEIKYVIRREKKRNSERSRGKRRRRENASVGESREGRLKSRSSLKSEKIYFQKNEKMRRS